MKKNNNNVYVHCDCPSRATRILLEKMGKGMGKEEEEIKKNIFVLLFLYVVQLEM